jgi:phage terminase small subunit
LGGRGSGGSRVGAGRKPKDAHLRAIQGGRSRIAIQPEAPTSTAVAPLVEVLPPGDLMPDELAVWTREAPLATTERTLTPSTAGAFREFCELEALKNTMLKRIRARLTMFDVAPASESGKDQAEPEFYEKANPLLTHYRGAVQRLSAFRKDFKLAPFGKELIAPEQPKSNPIDRFRKRG